MFKKRWIALFLATLATIIAPLFIWGPFQQKRPFLRIPIVMSHDKPCVRVTIEGKDLLFHLDSGGSDCFSMHRGILEDIKNKTLIGTKTWHDINGTLYTTSEYRIKEMNINTFYITNATVTEESFDFLFTGCKLKVITQSTEKTEREIADIAGRLGPRTLRILNYWLIDLPNSSIIAIRDLEKIKTMPGFTFDDFTEVTLEETSPHIVISVETDVGIKKLALDTGAYRSILTPPSAEYRSHEILQINRLMIGEQDFGNFTFYLFHMPTEEFQLDGILGRDFFRKHAIYLDFKENRAFIGPTLVS